MQSFALGPDTTAPRVDLPFTLVVTLRVRERVTHIDNLELPLLAELDLLGDERRLESNPAGTRYRETITVVAHRGGTLVIGSALLQAIDPRDGRAKQYATNGLTLQVSGPAPSLGGTAHTARNLAFALLRVMLWVGGALCTIVLIVLIFRRRPAAAVPAVDPAVTATSSLSVQAELADALAVLRAERTRASAVRVRALVWETLGATQGATLSDVLVHPQATQPVTRALLIALERAAFTYDADVSSAIDAASTALRNYIETLSPEKCT